MVYCHHGRIATHSRGSDGILALQWDRKELG